MPCDTGKMGSASPKSKTFNVKVPSHTNPLISNDFSCNRGNPDGVGVHAARAVAGDGWRARKGRRLET